MQPIIKLFFHIVEVWYTDTDLVYENNKEVRISCDKIIRKYKTYHSRAKHITQELIDRNYLQSEEDIIWCREFIRWYFVWLSGKITFETTLYYLLIYLCNYQNK